MSVFGDFMIDVASAKDAEIRKLTKALQIAELKASGTLANNLCPDHRDKQTGKPCLACKIEALEKEVQDLRNHIFNGADIVESLLREVPTDTTKAWAREWCAVEVSRSAVNQGDGHG